MPKEQETKSKKRAKNYDKKLAINGTLDDVLKVSTEPERKTKN